MNPSIAHVLLVSALARQVAAGNALRRSPAAPASQSGKARSRRRTK